MWPQKDHQALFLSVRVWRWQSVTAVAFIFIGPLVFIVRRIFLRLFSVTVALFRLVRGHCDLLQADSRNGNVHIHHSSGSHVGSLCFHGHVIIINRFIDMGPERGISLLRSWGLVVFRQYHSYVLVCQFDERFNVLGYWLLTFEV